MKPEAFAFSEEWKTPVFFRATTRVDHGYESIEVKDPSEYEIHKAEGFVKDSSKWVIFPALSVRSHARIEERNAGLSVTLSDYRRNFILPACGTYDGVSGRKPALRRENCRFIRRFLSMKKKKLNVFASCA